MDLDRVWTDFRLGQNLDMIHCDRKYQTIDIGQTLDLDKVWTNVRLGQNLDMTYLSTYQTMDIGESLNKCWTFLKYGLTFEIGQSLDKLRSLTNLSCTQS